MEFDVAEWANVLSNGRQRMMGRAVGKVLAGQAPDLRQALERARGQGNPRSGGEVQAASG